MTNTPLSSTDHSKILIFTLLMLPPTGFFIGILPSIFLLFGIFMMKKNGDFSHIVTSVRNVKLYLYAIIAAGSCCAAWFATTLGAANSWERLTDQFIASCAATATAFVYALVLDKLFYSPLAQHSEWVARNGILSNKAKNAPEKSDIDIIKGERLKSFSVADELLKWAKLKEDGHISEQEYNDARNKLMQRD